jgi:hypothetical protein
MNIHIGNLSPDTTEEELRKLFSKFGKVKSVNILKYPNSLSKSYGFIDKPVSIETEEEMDHLNSMGVKEKIIIGGKARSNN